MRKILIFSFQLLESLAEDCGWGDSERTLLLQSVFVGKAQEALIALPGPERKCYQRVKKVVIKSHESNS